MNLPPKDKAVELAENVWLRLVSRVATAIGLPILGFVSIVGYGYIVSIAEEQHELSSELSRLSVIVVERLIPDIESNENQIENIDFRLRAVEADRFTDANAETLEGRLQRQIDQILRRLENAS